jgi:hypothetical protein
MAGPPTLHARMHVNTCTCGMSTELLRHTQDTYGHTSQKLCSLQTASYSPHREGSFHLLSTYIPILDCAVHSGLCNLPNTLHMCSAGSINTTALRAIDLGMGQRLLQWHTGSSEPQDTWGMGICCKHSNTVPGTACTASQPCRRCTGPQFKRAADGQADS